MLKSPQRCCSLQWSTQVPPSDHPGLASVLATWKGLERCALHPRSQDKRFQRSVSSLYVLSLWRCGGFLAKLIINKLKRGWRVLYINDICRQECYLVEPRGKKNLNIGLHKVGSWGPGLSTWTRTSGCLASFILTGHHQFSQAFALFYAVWLPSIWL